MVKNPPSNAGDAGSIPGRGTKIPHATGQLGPRTANEHARATGEPACCNYRAHLLGSPRATIREKPAHHNKDLVQLRPDAAKK